MNLIKNAIVYRATLPDAQALEAHLKEKAFKPVLETMSSSAGFVQNAHTERLVSEFPGGYSFRLRREQKAVSLPAIKLELSRRVAALEEQGRQVSKEEAATISEEIFSEAIKNALPTPAELEAFYHVESRTLIVPTTNKNFAGRLVFELIEACGAVETSTIHVSNIKGGLTARLSNYFIDGKESAFDGFALGDSVLMRGSEGKASFDLESLDHARHGIREALSQQMEVERMELCHADSVNFKLTKDFHLRAISFIAGEFEETDFDTTGELWSHSAGVQVGLMVATVKALCDLFGYKEQAKDEAAATA